MALYGRRPDTPMPSRLLKGSREKDKEQMREFGDNNYWKTHGFEYELDDLMLDYES